MGTRGAFGYRIDGQDSVTYNHCDSYPDGLGSNMVDYVGAYSIEALAEAARRIVLVEERDKAPREMVERYREFADLSVASRDPADWYVLLRGVQRNPGAFHAGVDHMINGNWFLKDSLFCEWAYIVNVDDGVLEVYRGFNRDPKAPGRYAAFQGPNPTRASSEYYGVRLLLTVPFYKLRGLSVEGRDALLKSWEKAAEEKPEEKPTPPPSQGQDMQISVVTDDMAHKAVAHCFFSQEAISEDQSRMLFAYIKQTRALRKTLRQIIGLDQVLGPEE